MAIFDLFKKKVKDAEPAAPDTATTTQSVGVSDVANAQSESADTEKLWPELDDPLLKALIQNEEITRDKAMMIPAVSSAVDFIAGSIASMPVKLCKRKNGRVIVVDRDSRIRLLNGDTGDVLNSNQLKYAMVEDYLLDKGGFAYVQRELNEVTGIFYVEPVYVVSYRGIDPIYKYVRYQIGERYLRNWELIRLLRHTKDGATGIGLVREVEKALQAAYATMLFQLRQVKTGGGKRGFLKTESKVSDDALRKVKAAFMRLYGGAESESVVVLNKGLDFQEASSTSVELQLNQTLKTLNDEIAKIFHIHDDFNQTFKEAIYPAVKAFEAALNSALLLENEKKKDYFFEIDVKEIIKATIKERFEAYKLAKDTGLMTINELRSWESMNPVDGMDVIAFNLGDVLFNTESSTYFTPNMAITTDLRGNTTVQETTEDGNVDPEKDATETEDDTKQDSEKNKEGGNE